jgi:hypothetical protein
MCDGGQSRKAQAEHAADLVGKGHVGGCNDAWRIQMSAQRTLKKRRARTEPLLGYRDVRERKRLCSDKTGRLCVMTYPVRHDLPRKSGNSRVVSAKLTLKAVSFALTTPNVGLWYPRG